MQLEQKIKEAAEKFAALVQMQLERNERKGIYRLQKS